jgi:uncharacterized protein (UPF0333 family)
MSKLFKMKSKLLLVVTVFVTLICSGLSYAQRPNLGTANNFVLFSSNGEVKSAGGLSVITGNVGNNIGSSTGFGNVNGSMHDTDDVAKQCATDLLVAYQQLNNEIPAFFPSPVFGNGDTIVSGIYAINSAATLTGQYTLNAEGDTNAIFIIQIQGAFSTDTNSKVKLINGARACNIYWKVEGMVNLGPGTSFKGTIIAHDGAISMAAGDTLEGRALSTTGAITVNGVIAKLPLGFGLPILSGPDFPQLGTTSCFALFTSSGELTNNGITHVTGDIGTNVGLVTGFNNLFITGAVHNIPDLATSVCAIDLLALHTELHGANHEIELLYPAQFGHKLELTPHIYLLDAATMLTDTVYFNAQGNADAVFVIQVNGAFATTVGAKVILTNGAQAKNIFWKVEGAVSIESNTDFSGTIIANNGAINLSTGVVLHGRALSTTGKLLTFGIDVLKPAGCYVTGLADQDQVEANVLVFPNPFSNKVTFEFNNQASLQATQLSIYNMLGTEIRTVQLNNSVTKVEEVNIPSGIYFYQLKKGFTVLQSGRLVSQL